MAQVTAPHLHMQEPEAHVRAVEEDLEYYRVKRFEPRLINLHRRHALTFYDLLDAVPAAMAWRSKAPAGESPEELEQRIRALEDGLDEYVWGIAVLPSLIGGHQMVIEDGRKESGSYDDFFRISKPAHGGALVERIARLEHDLSQYSRLLSAFTRAVIAKGATTQDELDRKWTTITTPSIWNGGRIVARAWTDPAFKERLLIQPREAVRDLGIPPGRLGQLGVAENTASTHNVVVCTLCSCYPYNLLGDVPWWYKHDSYRDRVVRDPRATLTEMFDFTVPEHVQVRVWDSTSDIRWIVIPRRPAGTDNWSEDELARLVTQESLIGVAEALTPEQLAQGAPPPPRASLSAELRA
jgi:nitrile hydratase